MDVAANTIHAGAGGDLLQGAEIFIPLFALPGAPGMGNAAIILSGVHHLHATDFILG
ncbi:hypothetical protein [Belnapia rosea]|uniref:Uncharacterized protein n=1 Tax=Belnapia rosea TaxID=938405 RepID=A0A1G6Y2C2_9PROT|nr:hypothetical protein [Belnapia rosea]SDB72754.1 hypothetical protein SAMN02927895_04527 [Belnapia rosea]SDD84549.1 hypothetical protein SAMN04487779_101377 [Belnapia rosea]